MAAEKLKIGLLVSHLEDVYTNEVCRGAIIGARDNDVDIVILPGRYLDPPINADNEDFVSALYPAIFNFAKNAGLSALVVSIGTIGSFVDKDRMESFISSFAPLPVVTLAVKVGNRPCILHSEREGLKEEIEHFINVHGRKRIAYITGPKGNVDAERRVAVYKQTLIANGLEYDPELVCYSNFSEYCRKIVEPFMRKCLADGVDTFCFANDAMASFSYTFARENDMVIGRDFLIASFDNTYKCTAITPPMSSISADAAELGYTAVGMAMRAARNESVSDVVLQTRFICRDSCGCALYNGIPANTGETSEAAAARVRDDIMGAFKNSASFRGLYDDLYGFLFRLYEISRQKGTPGIHDPSRKHELLRLCDRLVELTGSVERLPEVIMKMYGPSIGFSPDETAQVHTYSVQGLAIWCINLSLFKYNSRVIGELSGISFFSNDVTFISSGRQGEQFYRAVIKRLKESPIKAAGLLMYESPVPADSFDKWKKPDTVLLRGMFDGDEERITEDGGVTPTSEVFNIIPAKGDALVLLPLIGSEEHFGIMLCRVGSNGLAFAHNVAAHLSVSVKIADLVARLDHQVEELNKNATAMRRLSLTDDLTGLLNRRGFFEIAGSIVNDDEFNGHRAAVVYGDLDGLKFINDNFGHSEGDEALRCTGRCLLSVFPNEMFVASRVGGDEFAMMYLLEDDMTAQDVVEKVKERLAELSAAEQKPYKVEMSLGTIEFMCSPAISLTAVMSQADTMQYVEKEKSHERRGIKK